MSGVAAAIGIGTVAVGAYGANQAGKAAKAQAKSYDAATAEQARQFDAIQEQQRPWIEAGRGALNQLAALYGIGMGSSEPLSYEDWLAQQGEPIHVGGNGLAGAIAKAQQDARFRGEYQQYVDNFQPAGGGAPNFENFLASPDYQFALQQGLQGVQNSAAARGGLYSGNALRGITEFGQGMAAQQLGNYTNRLASIAGIGQTATNQLTGASQNFSNNVSNLLVGQGNARASGIIGQGNAWTNTANQLAMLYGMGAFGGGGSGGAGIHAGNWGYGIPGYGSMV